jgi:hypothetical protein
MSYAFCILDTRFTATSAEPRLLDYSRAFMEAYAADEEPLPAAQEIALSVERAAVDGGPGRTVPVHRSKHGYWTFPGVVVGERPRRVVWPSRGVMVSFCREHGSLDVAVGADTPAAVAGEAVFHACRSLALYLRRAEAGLLVHASAVTVDGAAVIFTGDVMAGKTTVMTEAVLRHGAVPLSNDRVWLRPEDPPQAVSWPSYASFCEGTLLNYPPLAEAALRYEDPAYPHRTQTWPWPLRPVFAKDSKRTYPMMWFAEAAGVRFLPRAPLGAVVLTRCAPDAASAEPEPIDLRSGSGRARLTAALASQVFDTAEPSFLPWHGLPLPRGAPAVTRIVDQLGAAGVAAFALTVNPSDLTPIKELLWKARHFARTSS